MNPGQLYAAAYEYVLSAKDDPDLINLPQVRTALDRVIGEMKALAQVVEPLRD